MNEVSSSDIARMLRAQAWERAKAELQAMLPTFKSADPTNCSPGQFAKLTKTITAFINSVEHEALNE